MHTVTVIPLTKFHLAVVMLWEQTREQKVNDRKCMFSFMIQVRRSITPTLIPGELCVSFFSSFSFAVVYSWSIL